MRDYGRVHSKFWASGDMRSLTDDGRLLALYLLSGPHGTITGVFRLPDGYACEDLNWSAERVQEGFRELSLNGFANRCETTKWVWITKFLLWNRPENPNQWKAARKLVESIPRECDWRVDFKAVFAAIERGGEVDLQTLTKGLGKPFRNQEQEQKQEQKQEREGEPPTRSRASASKPEIGEPAGLNREAFERWETYLRLEHGKTLGVFSRPGVMSQLVAFGDAATQAAVVENCIVKRSKNLHPIDDRRPASGQARAPRTPPKTADDYEQEHRRAQ